MVLHQNQRFCSGKELKVDKNWKWNSVHHDVVCMVQEHTRRNRRRKILCMVLHVSCILGTQSMHRSSSPFIIVISNRHWCQLPMSFFHPW